MISTQLSYSLKNYSFQNRSFLRFLISLNKFGTFSNNYNSSKCNYHLLMKSILPEKFGKKWKDIKASENHGNYQNQFVNLHNYKKQNQNLHKLIFFGLGLSGLILSKIRYNEIKKTITLQEFVNCYLSKNLVEKIVVNKEKGKAYLKSNENSNQEVVYFSIGDLISFEEKLKDVQMTMGINTLNFVPIKYSHLISGRKIINDLLPTLIGITLTILLLRAFSKSISNSASDKLIKSGFLQYNQFKNPKQNIKFSDIAGMKEAKQEIYEFVEFLKDPKKFEILGAKIPRGALLVGPPGTGKTLLAKAVAGEANVPFFFISGSDFIEIFVGIGASRVRELFSQARKFAPSIIFIDEIDAIGRKRAKSGGFASTSNDERESTLNQILVEMDGFTDNNGVVVLASTNRSDVLDPALTRPGRFDRTINIEKPTLEERKEIFKVHLDPIKLNQNINKEYLINYLASLSPGFVGSEIKNLCNEAAIYAARRKSLNGVDIIDFDKASDKIIGGLKKIDGYLSSEEKKIVSIHESGHAIAGWFLKYADPVIKVSIVPRTSGALGFTQMNLKELKLFSKNELLDKIAVLLAGRAAEELFTQSITTGASDDLSKATNIANSIITHYGMDSEIGLPTYYSIERGITDNYGIYSLYKPFSESTAKAIDMKIHQIIHDQYNRVKELLNNKKQLVHRLADLLIEKETVSEKDIIQCIGPNPFKK